MGGILNRWHLRKLSLKLAVFLLHWSFAASHPFMHFKHRCTWKSSQFYIIIGMAGVIHACVLNSLYFIKVQ